MPKRFLSKRYRGIINILNGLFGFDVDYFVRGGVFIFSADIVKATLGLLLSVVFARLVSQDYYGQYKFFLSIIGILGIITLPGMATAMTRSVAKGYDGSFIVATKHRIKSGLIGSVILIVSSFWCYYAENYLWLAFFISAFIFPFHHSMRNISSFFMAKKDFAKVNNYNIFSYFFSALLVAGSLILYRNIVITISGFLFGQFFVSIYYWFYIKSKFVFEKTDETMVSYGKHLSYINILNSAAFYIDKLIINLFLGFQQVAIYSIAAIVPEIMKSTMKQFGSMMFPKFSVIEGSIYQKIKGKIFLVFTITSIFILIAIILIPFMLDILYPESYESAILIAQLLLISIVVALVNSIFLSILRAKQRIKELYVVNLAYSITLIVSLLVLTPLLKLKGVALSYVITRVSSTAILWFTARKY